MITANHRASLEILIFSKLERAYLLTTGAQLGKNCDKVIYSLISNIGSRFKICEFQEKKKNIVGRGYETALRTST